MSFSRKLILFLTIIANQTLLLLVLSIEVPGEPNDIRDQTTPMILALAINGSNFIHFLIHIAWIQQYEYSRLCMNIISIKEILVIWISSWDYVYTFILLHNFVIYNFGYIKLSAGDTRCTISRNLKLLPMVAHRDLKHWPKHIYKTPYKFPLLISSIISEERPFV